LGLKTGNETDDLIALDANAQRVCSLNQTEQLHMYERHMQDNSIFDRRTTKPHAQCFNAAFSYHLLSKSFGLPLADTPIEVYHHIGGTKVQWALGMMLVEANKLGSMFKEHAHTNIIDDVGTPHGLAGHFTYFAIILLALMLGLWRFRRKRSSEGLPLVKRSSEGLPLVEPRGIIPYFSPRKGK
jgi:hypothetical protein